VHWDLLAGLGWRAVSFADLEVASSSESCEIDPFGLVVSELLGDGSIPGVRQCTSGATRRAVVAWVANGSPWFPVAVRPSNGFQWYPSSESQRCPVSLSSRLSCERSPVVLSSFLGSETCPEASSSVRLVPALRVVRQRGLLVRV
jgi:hypothetical protein